MSCYHHCLSSLLPHLCQFNEAQPHPSPLCTCSQLAGTHTCVLYGQTPSSGLRLPEPPSAQSDRPAAAADPGSMNSLHYQPEPDTPRESCQKTAVQSSPGPGGMLVGLSPPWAAPPRVYSQHAATPLSPCLPCGSLFPMHCWSVKGRAGGSRQSCWMGGDATLCSSSRAEPSQAGGDSFRINGAEHSEPSHLAPCPSNLGQVPFYLISDQVLFVVAIPTWALEDVQVEGES